MVLIVDKAVSLALVAPLTRAEGITIALATLLPHLTAWTDALASTWYAEVALLSTRAYAAGVARHADYTINNCAEHCWFALRAHDFRNCLNVPSSPTLVQQ